jgi:DNA polymerase-4
VSTKVIFANEHGVYVCEHVHIGIEYCHQLRELSQKKLNDKFGKFGNSLYNYCRGIDNREVTTSRISKSISVENTYPNNLMSLNQCLVKLPELYQKLVSRASNKIDRASGIFIKVTDSNFKKTSVARQTRAIDMTSFENLLPEIYQKQDTSIRLLGIGFKLEEESIKQMDFDL